MRKMGGEWVFSVALACLFGLPGPAGAQSADAASEVPPEAKQALSVLLGSFAEGESVLSSKPRSQTAMPVPTRQRVTTRKGETLDGVLRRTLSHLPIKDTVLRAAFVDVNPDAFVNGSPHRLKAGVELFVPSPEDVRRIMLKDSGGVSVAAKPAPASASTATAAAPSPSEAVASEQDMRDWVRYP